MSSDSEIEVDGQEQQRALSQANKGKRRASGPSSQSAPEAKDGPSYDPDQDPGEKRKVRKEYRDLNKSTEGNVNPNEFTAEQLVENVKRANTLFAEVKGPQEATLDSAFLLMASNMGAIKARAIKSGPAAFDADEFVSRLLAFMGGGRQVLRETREDGEDGSEFEEDGEEKSLDWDRVGRLALAKSRRVPVMDFMLGSLSIEAKKRAQTKRARLEKDEKDKTKPQEINEEDITRSENETTANVAQVERILGDHDRINLFRFVINPDDFGQSVENLFYLSFLIRDGKCALEIDEETAEPMIFLCEQPSEEDYKQGIQKQQIVLELDMATWERAKQEFNITQPIIPQREVRGMRIGSKWYG